MLQTTRRQDVPLQLPAKGDAKGDVTADDRMAADDTVETKPCAMNALHDQAYWEAVDRFDMPSA